MSGWFFGPLHDLLAVPLAALAMYGTALLVLRLGDRRTLAELSMFDVVVAMSIGAIVGRTVTTESPPWSDSATAIVVLVVLHAGVARVRRRSPLARRVFSRSPIVLVRDGVLDEAACRQAAMTRGDVAAVLRRHGIADEHEVALVVLEGRGTYSVLRTPPAPGSLVATELPAEATRSRSG